MSAVKMCRRCLKDKPLSEFSRRRYAGDGRNCWCKDCVNTDLRERRATGAHVLTHGYGGYTNGCRCEICREAKRANMAARRAAAWRSTGTDPVLGVTHGTRSAYEERGCRCPVCVQAQMDPERKRKRAGQGAA